MASNINWNDVGAVQRSFDRGPAVKIDKEDVAMLGRSIGDIAGRYNRAATVDNDPELEELKRKLRDAENAKAAAQASGALGGDIDVSPYDEDIEVLKMKIAGREEKVRQLRGEYANDPEYLTARREYVVNGDRSHLDSFWRNREAAKLRKAQEEAAKVENAKLVAEQEKDRKLSLEQARGKVGIAIANLKDAKSVTDKERARNELNIALSEFRHAGGDPDEIMKGEGTEGSSLTKESLDLMKNELAALSKAAVVTDGEVAAFVDKMKPYTEDAAFGDEARKMISDAEGLRTTEKKAKAAGELYAKEKKAIDRFNEQKEDWLRLTPTLGELKNFVFDKSKLMYVPRNKK